MTPDVHCKKTADISAKVEQKKGQDQTIRPKPCDESLKRWNHQVEAMTRKLKKPTLNKTSN